ncbi:MAG: glutamyl-tRNA reductase [Acidobacteriota bacterium]
MEDSFEDAAMNLRLVGLSHKTAPLEVRERLHVGTAELRQALTALDSVPRVRECFILSTCNRVEVVAEIEKSRDGEGTLTNFLCDYNGERLEELSPHLYRYRATGAIAHLFRVAASLDSMVIGEPQIVAQVREALAAARSVGTVGPVLGPVLDRALVVGKRVRTETGIGRSAVSIATAAVELARKIFGDLRGRRALLLGAGEMSELAAQRLVKHGVDTVLVANRSPRRAARLAAAFNGQVVDWGESLAALVDADIVIASTASPHTLVSVEAVRRILPQRRYRPIFFIDIAVPRDIEAGVNALDNVYLYDIDDLQGVVEENLASRSRRAEAAEELVVEELERFVGTLSSRDVAPTIKELRSLAETLRREEVGRAKRKLASLSPEQEKAVEALSRGLVNKLLHRPITALKEEARDGRGQQILHLLRRLYRLDD